MKLGVIGCGNMASAVIQGLFKGNSKIEFLTYTPSFTRADILAKKVNGTAVKELVDLKNCNSLLIGCKPQQFDELANSLKGFDLSNTWIISIMAAISINTISTALNSKYITRLMPNIPMQYDTGISLLVSSKKRKLELYKEFINDLKSVSEIYEMDNENIYDKVTIIASSGPAYIYYISKIFEEKLSEWGINKKISKEIIIQLLRGSCMVMEKNMDSKLSELISAVTSKAGITIEAINSFNKDSIDSKISKGIEMAYNRSLELSNEYNS